MLSASRSPRELLARLIEDDPLGLERRTRTRLAELALLVDAERLYLRATARVAFAAVRRHGDEALEPWLEAQIDRAAADLIDEDRTAERNGSVPGPDEARYTFLADALGVETSAARRACVVFNGLPQRVRRVWWAAVVESRSLASCVAEGLGSSERVRADLRRALLTLSMLQDPGGPEHGGDGRGV